jgi:acetylglutamate kinase
MDMSNYAGCLLNINGDTVASHIACTVRADKIIFLTDVEGIMDNSGRVISRLNKRSATLLLASQTIKGGMIPKVEACISALDYVGVANIVDGRNPGALLESIHEGTGGTQISL